VKTSIINKENRMKKVLGLLLALTVMVSMTVPTFGQQQDDKKTETAKKGEKKSEKKADKKGDKKKGDKKDDKKADDSKK